MIIQIINNGITLRIEKNSDNLSHMFSLPLNDVLYRILCISGSNFGKIFSRGEDIETSISDEELDNINKKDGIPIAIRFMLFMNIGYMSIIFIRNGKFETVAVPLRMVADKGIKI